MKEAIVLIILLGLSTVTLADEERVIIPNEGWSITFDSPRYPRSRCQRKMKDMHSGPNPAGWTYRCSLKNLIAWETHIKIVMSSTGRRPTNTP